jgi:hypothetical protein
MRMSIRPMLSGSRLGLSLYVPLLEKGSNE